MRTSGLSAEAGISTDEPRLPVVVLLDTTELIELTLACGSFTVVTSSLGTSTAVRENMLALISGEVPVGRPVLLEGLCEKKRGERGPSRFTEGTAGLEAAEGISKRRGGEEPVRGFLK